MLEKKRQFFHNLFQMDTNRLRQFCAIAETGSISKASRLLHMTHSGLSKSMKLLQAETGYHLLQPMGRGLALTETGMQFWQRARRCLEYEQRLLRLDLHPVSSTLRIGSVEIFLPLLSGLLADCPFGDIPVSLLDLDPQKMAHMIAQRQLDYAVSYVPCPLPDVEIAEAGGYQLGCWYLEGVFDQCDLSDIPFVVPAESPDENFSGIRERDGWLDSISPRYKKYTVNLLSTALMLTLQGLCAIHIPDFIAKKINATRQAGKHLVQYPLPNKQKIRQTVFVITHREQLHNPEFKKICKMLKNVLSSHDF